MWRKGLQKRLWGFWLNDLEPRSNENMGRNDLNRVSGYMIP